jgi:glycosyltransferase involved in cell wall biosynthesis
VAKKLAAIKIKNMKVSICIPSYKQTVYLRRVLTSIHEQDFNDYEIIITDDTPDDSIKKLIDEFDFQGRLKYFKNQPILGTPENWNEAIRKAHGEYIKIIHHDDFFTYNYSLGEFVKMLDDNPECDFAFSSSLNLDKDFKTLNQHCPTPKELDLIKKSPDQLFFSAIIGAPSATIFRNKKTIFFNKSLKWLVDMDFYIRVLKNNKNFIYYDKPLISTVDAPNRVTVECVNDKNIFIGEMLFVLKKISHNNQKDLKFLKFLINNFITNGITSIPQLKQYNTKKIKLPFVVYVSFVLSRIYVIFFKRKYSSI